MKYNQLPCQKQAVSRMLPPHGTRDFNSQEKLEFWISSWVYSLSSWYWLAVISPCYLHPVISPCVSLFMSASQKLSSKRAAFSLLFTCCLPRTWTEPNPLEPSINMLWIKRVQMLGWMMEPCGGGNVLYLDCISILTVILDCSFRDVTIEGNGMRVYMYYFIQLHVNLQWFQK